MTSSSNTDGIREIPSVTLESGVGQVGDILDVFIDNGQYSERRWCVNFNNCTQSQNTKVTAYPV